MGGMGTERSVLILGFAPHPSNAVTPLRDYESHAIRLLTLALECGFHNKVACRKNMIEALEFPTVPADSKQ
jgi:hypothetical protein